MSRPSAPLCATSGMRRETDIPASMFAVGRSKEMTPAEAKCSRSPINRQRVAAGNSGSHIMLQEI